MLAYYSPKQCSRCVLNLPSTVLYKLIKVINMGYWPVSEGIMQMTVNMSAESSNSSFISALHAKSLGLQDIFIS